MAKISQLLLVLIFTGWSQFSNSTVIYSYTGNYFDVFQTNGIGTPPDPYTTSDRITGWFELLNPLAPDLLFVGITPLAFSFMDGVNTIDDATATTISFQVATDSIGTLIGWDIQIWVNSIIPNAGGPLKGISTFDTPELDYPFILDSSYDALCGANTPSTSQCGVGSVSSYIQIARNYESPGTWSVRQSVPVPATLALFGLGLAGLGWSRRKKA